MISEIVSFGGWQRNLCLRNDSVVLVVTLDVGPRVLKFSRIGGANVFKNYEEQLGSSGESEWKIRGGHRIWIAPEDEVLSYVLDNVPTEYRVEPDGSVTFITPACPPWQLRKELTIKLNGAEVEVRHLVVNESGPPIEAASWGLSVMAPDGTGIIPQPPLGEHPRDLQANRSMVIWPYTDLSDPRWKLGRRYFTLRQVADGLPTKIGLSHRVGWVGYILGRELFVKTIPWDPGARYPDGGCNFETFTNPEMLELESLGPLRTLAAGDSVGHVEKWRLFQTDGQAPLDDENALAAWLEPYVNSL